MNKKRKKVVVIFGTRPEAIKLAPVIRELKSNESIFQTFVCATGQHKEMLAQMMEEFQITADYSLDIMKKNQSLFYITAKTLSGFERVISEVEPDIVLVQGDTTTSLTGALAAYYAKVTIGHVEAGLRTHDKYNPYPEEKNRHLISVLADYHFAPTDWARSNLEHEGVSADRIWVTGNTAIDSLLHMKNRQNDNTDEQCLIDFFSSQWDLDFSLKNQRTVLVTAHRRESFGRGLQEICFALLEIARTYPDIRIVYPVHFNPNVQKVVYEMLQTDRYSNIFLLPPLEYSAFVFLMTKSYIILTDSGGIQEEAPSLNIPVLVMRDATERPEGIQAGTSLLVGTDAQTIFQSVESLISKQTVYERMAGVKNPYGDGKASERIVKILQKQLGAV